MTDYVATEIVMETIAMNAKNLVGRKGGVIFVNYQMMSVNATLAVVVENAKHGRVILVVVKERKLKRESIIKKSLNKVD